MSKDTLRIEIPIDRPDDFLDLCSAISQKHNADPSASPLDSAMMSTFDTNLADAQAKRATARQQHSIGEERLGASRTAMGFASYQSAKSPGTLNNIVLQVRDLLNVVNRPNPEATSLWGFDVVVGGTGGRVTVKYNIPTNHDDFLDLADAIWTKHGADGTNSPLVSLDMATFDTKRLAARTARNAGKAAHALAESENGAADVLMGKAEHQNSRSPGTLYYDILGIRDVLKIHNQENPEALSLWGFDVVVGRAAVGRKAKATVNILAQGSETGNPALESIHVFEQTTAEDVGNTDVNGMVVDEGQVPGTRRYEFSGLNRVTKVEEKTVVKGINNVVVFLDPV